VLGIQAGEHHGLVGTQAGGFVHGPGAAAGAVEVLSGAGDEASAALMQPTPPGEVQEAARIAVLATVDVDHFKALGVRAVNPLKQICTMAELPCRVIAACLAEVRRRWKRNRER
jgi:hypothetical protein